MSVDQSSRHHLAEGCKVLVAFAAAQVDTKANRIVDCVQNSAIDDGLFRGPGSKLGMPPALFPDCGILATVSDVPVFDFGADLGWKATGIKQSGFGDTTFALFQSSPNGIDIMAHRD